MRLRKPQIPHISECLRDGEWQGQPVFVIGGGPSLRPLVDAGRLEELQPFRRIGINVAWRDPPYPHVVVAKDHRVLDDAEDHHGELWRAIDQLRVTDGVHASRRAWTRTCFYDPVPRELWGRTFVPGDHCRSGLLNVGNSGVAAINLADVLGASAIFLLGFDGEADEGGRLNWHDRYPVDWQPTGPWAQRMRRHFEYVAGRPRAPVVNCNPQSAITVFPTCAFDDALECARSLVQATTGAIS